MKLFASLLAASVPTVTQAAVTAAELSAGDKCIICEFTGFADSEANALAMLAGEEAVTSLTADLSTATSEELSITTANPCIAGGYSLAFDESMASGAIRHPLSSEQDDYCVATFFLYHAKDINRYVYGVKRTVSASQVTGTQTDLSHYEGVKGWSMSTKSDGSEGGCGTVPGIGEAAGDCSGGCVAFNPVNPRFTKRGDIPQCITDTSAFTDATANRFVVGTPTGSAITFMRDGREATPSSTATTVTTPQAVPYTLCLVCSGSQEFIEQPTTASQITDPCWNPSGSTKFLTDDASARDLNQYCVPNNGMCRTNTWQYATKNAVQTTSYWVGIERGCQEDQTTAQAKVVSYTNIWRNVDDGFTHGTNRGADKMEKFVRYYVASNTASKAKDIAKYPDAGTNPGSSVGIIPFAYGNGNGGVSATDYRWVDASKTLTVGKGLTMSIDNTETSTNQHYYYKYGWVGAGLAGAAGVDDYDLTGYSGAACNTDDVKNYCVRSLEQPMTPQFMSADGNGPPDVPALQPAVAELECIHCATPIGNTNAENTCVTAKTKLTVKCKTLACSSIVSNYKLEAGETAETFYYAKRGCAADPDDGVRTGDQTQADQFVIPAGYTGIKQTNQRVSSAKANTIQASSISTAKVMDCYSCNVHLTATVKGANPTEPTYDDLKTQDTSLCWQTFAPQVDTSIAATGTSGRCENSCYVQAYKYRVTTGPTNSPVTDYIWHLERGCAKADSKMKTGSVPSKDLFGVTITNSLCDWRNGSLCNGQLEDYDTSLQLKTQTVRQIQCFTCETPAGNTDPNHECYTVPSTAKATDCGDLSFVSCTSTETTFTDAGNVTTYGMVRGCSKEASGGSETPVDGYSNVMAKTKICSTSNCNKVAGSIDNIVVAVGAATEPATEDGGSSSNDAAEPVAEESNAMKLIVSLALTLAMLL